MAAGEVIEEVAEGFEEAAEVTRRLDGRALGFFIVGAGIGASIGFAVGYRIAEKRLKLKYEKIAEDEISNMREHYRQKLVAAEQKPALDIIKEEKYRHGEFTPEEQAAIDEVNALYPAEGESEEAPVVAEETTSVSRTNVFASDDPEVDLEWNYQEEIAKRSKDVPYIIHVDEFRENAPEHDQVTYTYYEIDDTLANQRDLIIEDMDAAICLGNLGHWGKGSGDVNVVYIRNEEMQLDFEVLRDRGSFADHVSGTIRHSASRLHHQRSKRKFDDES